MVVGQDSVEVGGDGGGVGLGAVGTVDAGVAVGGSRDGGQAFVQETRRSLIRIRKLYRNVDAPARILRRTSPPSHDTAHVGGARQRSLYGQSTDVRQ